MDAAIAAAILWAATGVRIYSTIRRPDTGRILMTAAAVCVACAFTLAPLRVTFDEMLGWPNGAELVQHLLFATAGLLTLLFLHVIRTGRLSLAALAGHVAAFTAAATTMVVAFSAADIHGATAAHFATEYAHDGFAVAYRLVFYAYLAASLVAISATCLRNAALDGDRAGRLSLFGIGVGAAAAVVAALAGASQMTAIHLTGASPALVGAVNTAGIAVAGIVAGVGVLVPLPVDAYLRWRRARTTTRSLHPLWRDLTVTVPEVVLPIPDGASPIHRAELTATRHRIEIADALGRIRIPDQDANAVVASDDPTSALGRTLGSTRDWRNRGSNGAIAADLLPHPAGRDDLPQLLAIADAYGTRT